MRFNNNQMEFLIEVCFAERLEQVVTQVYCYERDNNDRGGALKLLKEIEELPEEIFHEMLLLSCPNFSQDEIQESIVDFKNKKIHLVDQCIEGYDNIIRFGEV